MNDSAIFWMVMGALSVLVGISATYWAKDLGFKMNWFKWVLVVLWYLFFWLTVASPFTLIGENEATAGLKIIPFLLVPLVVFGVIIWRYLKFDPDNK